MVATALDCRRGKIVFYPLSFFAKGLEVAEPKNRLRGLSISEDDRDESSRRFSQAMMTTKARGRS